MGLTQGCLLTPSLYSIILEVLDNATREIKCKRIGNETAKLSVFSDGIILDIEDSKDSADKLLELMREFSKFTRYTFKIPKSIIFLHINSRKKSTLKMPFIVTSKRSRI